MPATRAPYYLPIGDEVDVFPAAYAARLPVLLKGPTGCGKTRFVEYMAHLLYRGERSTRGGARSSCRWSPSPATRT